MLLPAPPYELLLTGDGTESPNRRCPIPSHYIGRRGLGLPFWGGVRPQELTIYLGVDLLYLAAKFHLVRDDIEELRCLQHQGWVICFGVRLPRSLVDRIFYGEPCLYWGELIRCQSDHDDYACHRGGVAMSGGDGTCSSTQVPICQACVGACGQVLSCLELNGSVIRGPPALRPFV
jgi:hypothetical protein